MGNGIPAVVVDLSAGVRCRSSAGQPQQIDERPSERVHPYSALHETPPQTLQYISELFLLS